MKPLLFDTPTDTEKTNDLSNHVRRVPRYPVELPWDVLGAGTGHPGCRKSVLTRSAEAVYSEKSGVVAQKREFNDIRYQPRRLALH